jgi:hypothetical protein
MPDSSVNALVPGTTRDEHTAPVLREIGELIMLERSLGTCKNNEERYNVLVTIVERELPYALEFPPPAKKGTAEYARWEKDMAAMEKVLVDFTNLPAPSMPTPYANPLRGGEDTAYQYLLPGGRNLGTIEAEHTPYVLPTILRPETEKAYHRAMIPVRRMKIAIRRVLKRYGIWTENTEVALRLSDWSDEHGRQKITGAYVPPSEGDSGPSEEVGEIEDEEAEEGLGFMDPEL